MATDAAATNAQDADQAKSDELKRSVASAYAFVVGQETTESFAAVTFEELLTQQINRISEKGTDIRPNVLDRIAKVKNDIITAATTIKNLPSDFFKRHSDLEDTVSNVEMEEA
jgi:hypothetical protein